jgi:uncharacterized protein (TIGR03435 family)
VSKKALLLTVLLASPLSAQAPPSFEVASVKPNQSGDFRRGLGPEPGGRFVAMNVPLRDLVALAYGISNLDAESRVIGGPDWMARERFDVTAKAAGSPAPSDYPPMVKAMLAARFKLQAHDEVRDVQAFALVRARADGALGPQLRKSDVDCDARRAAAKGGAPLPQPASGAVCTGRTIPGTITATALSIGSLAGGLIRFAGRSVVDETGLAGYYDYELRWTPDQPPEPRPGEPPLVIDPNGPSLGTALQEQLGLRLESRRVPMKVVVIDRAELPTPD